MKLEYSLRPATGADYAFCYRLTKRNMHDLICRHWGKWSSDLFRQGFHVEDITLAIANGRRIGFYSLRRDATGLNIDSIQILSSLQGRGIETDMLRRILRQHNTEIINLAVFADNPAKQLYERLGFLATGSNGNMVHMSRLPE